MPTFVHGKDTVVTLNGTDFSEYANSTTFNDEDDTQETTTYGRDRKTYQYGLGDGTAEVSGFHNNTGSNNPRDLFKGLKRNKTIAEFVFQLEGTGTGKPQSVVDVLVKSYQETAPVAGMVQWQATLQMTGDLDETDQS